MAEYDPNWYPKGVKITDRQLAALPPLTTSTVNGTTRSMRNQTRREPLSIASIRLRCLESGERIAWGQEAQIWGTNGDRWSSSNSLGRPGEE
jgi:hypothetical protein